LSKSAHNEWVISERKKGEWELENYPEEEIRDVIGEGPQMVLFLTLCLPLVIIHVLRKYRLLVQYSYLDQ
jgi:hypothetical protein